MAIIYHITARAEWETARPTGWFAADTLRTEGFIHCSTGGQVLSTANRLFKGRTDLVLLCIDTDRVQAGIRYENLGGGASIFPHVYGPLATGSIRGAVPFPPGADGRFELPAGLSSINPAIEPDDTSPTGSAAQSKNEPDCRTELASRASEET